MIYTKAPISRHLVVFSFPFFLHGILSQRIVAQWGRHEFRGWEPSVLVLVLLLMSCGDLGEVTQSLWASLLLLKSVGLRLNNL